MTNFVKMTPLGAVEGDGEKNAFLLNADLIVSLQRVDMVTKGKSRTVVTTSGGQTYSVIDTPADIVAAIDLAEEAKNAPALPGGDPDPKLPSATAAAEAPTQQTQQPAKTRGGKQ